MASHMGGECLVPDTQLWSPQHLLQVTRFGQGLCPQGHLRTLTHNSGSFSCPHSSEGMTTGD